MKNTSITLCFSDEVKKAISSGCRMLAIREHSEKQIRTKLLAKGFGAEAVNCCINYLIDENWLSETRFCEVFIRSKAAKGQGLVRIEQELLHQNIERSTIDEQLESENIDWQQLCEKTLLKKVGSTNAAKRSTFYKDSNSKKQQKHKMMNFLRYRGFSNDEINIAIKKYLSMERREFSK